MKRFTGSQIITVLATIITISINALANILPLNGLNTGEISDRFDIFFVPAGYVFSIWGLIYLGLVVYSVYQVLPAQSDNPVLKKIAPYYWISSLANSIWIFLWHYEIFSVTLVAMAAILITLLMIYRMLNGAAGSDMWLVKLPFSIYLGWISVATIANASQSLFFFDWQGWGIAPEIWTVGMLATAGLLGWLMSWRENDTPYVLVLIWAFVGITVSQAGTVLVVNAAWAIVVLLAISIFTGIYKYRKVY